MGRLRGGQAQAAGDGHLQLHRIRVVGKPHVRCGGIHGGGAVRVREEEERRRDGEAAADAAGELISPQRARGLRMQASSA